MIPYSLWLNTSVGTRHKLAEIFGFKKVRTTHVSNNEVIDDGFELKDIEGAMTVPNLQGYLGVNGTDIILLFKMAVDKAEGKVQMNEVEPAVDLMQLPVLPETRRKPGRPKGYSPKRKNEQAKQSV